MDQGNYLERYFKEAKTWYNSKHLDPLVHRSYAICGLVIILLLVAANFVQINRLFPVSKTLKYAVSFDNSDVNKNIKIIPADDFASNQLNSIAKILLENYVVQRESYNYDELKKQMIFVRTNSTKSVFKQYYSFISIDNRLSPVLRYQDYINRKVEILITDISSDSIATVHFRSTAVDQDNNLVEQIIWQSVIEFQMDPITINQPQGTKYDFTVISYKVKLLQNEMATKNEKK
jgi:type IV secretion system protein VirB8